MNPNKFHLIGVGGIGMSALARLLISHEHEVSGSDCSTLGEVERLRKEGVTIFQGHHAEHIQERERTVVYSTAIQNDNPEIVQANSLKCNLWHRADLLSYLAQPYKAFAVAGTHGKTTTSALLTHVLISSQMSPTYVLGGILNEQQTNSAKGTGPYFVLEADESDGSLIKYHPYGSIVTNIEADHLDYYYKDLNHIQSCFASYITQIKHPQYFFWCKDCPNLQKLNPAGFSYGFHPESDLRILSYRQQGWSLVFSLDFQGVRYDEIELSMIGEQNVLNATAVFGIALQLNLSQEDIRQAFKTFKGVKRRSERLGSIQNIEFIDDYAHHPTEVQYVLKSLRAAFPQRKIIAVFQPHRYSRIKYFEEDFAHSFKKCSEVWLTDLYAAGEPKIDSFHEVSFAKKIQKNSEVQATYIPKEDLLRALLERVKPHDIVVTLGAGDITYFGRQALEEIKKKPPKLQIGLIYGSTSPEFAISKVSKDFFLRSLDPKIYDIHLFEIDLIGRWHAFENLSKKKELSSIDLLQSLYPCDYFFPIVHGPRGEDGMLQGFLETLNKPYAGSDYSSCSIAMNKIWTKAVAQKEGIEVAKYLSISANEWREQQRVSLKRITDHLKFPLVVKPSSLGSSIDVFFIKNEKALISAMDQVFRFENIALIEEKIVGREFEIALLEGKKLICTHPGEICSQIREYSYAAKYDSKCPFEKITQADLPKSQVKALQHAAKRIYKAIRAKGFIRLDFFINRAGKVIFNEANPIPGCASRSLFPKMLQAHGLTPEEILDQMVINGLYHHRLRAQNRRKTQHFVESQNNDTQ